MKKTICIISLISLIFLLVSCTAKTSDDSDQQNPNNSSISKTEEDINDIHTGKKIDEPAEWPSKELLGEQPDEPLDEQTNEQSNDTQTGESQESPSVSSSYNTKEIGRDANYKTMEMYTTDNGTEFTRRVTFEIPIEWYNSGSSVVGLQNKDDLFVIKVDMWDVKSATRESVLNEYNNSKELIDPADLIYENIYLTENYEIFYYKRREWGTWINVYYLYTNGERFCISSYAFEMDTPENDAIFKRVVESVKFQF
jgi:hypothetical protein